MCFICQESVSPLSRDISHGIQKRKKKKLFSLFHRARFPFLPFLSVSVVFDWGLALREVSVRHLKIPCQEKETYVTSQAGGSETEAAEVWAA